MDALKRNMRKRAFALPVAVGLVVFCVLGLAMAPMFAATPKDVPMAIVNLDEGATLPNGEHMNAGELVAEKMVEGGAVEDASEENGGGEAASPIAWTQLESEHELDEALDAGEFYGALVIPADFTEARTSGQAAVALVLQEGLAKLTAQGGTAAGAAAASPQAAQAAQTQAMQGLAANIAQAQQDAEKPQVRVVLNLAKSPMLAQNLQPTLTMVLAQAGIEADVETIGESLSDDSPLANMMSIQFMVMPLFMMSLIMGIAVVALRWPRKGTRAEKGRESFVQLLYCMAASLLAAVLAFGMVAWIGGVDIDAAAIWLLWLASFCLMTATIGLCDIALPLGALVMVFVFAIGMGTAVLPAPMLPEFWADWVLPWAPQACIGDGLRNVIYLHEGAFSAGVWPLLAWGCVGIVGAAIAALLPPWKKSAPDAPSEQGTCL